MFEVFVDERKYPMIENTQDAAWDIVRGVTHVATHVKKPAKIKILLDGKVIYQLQVVA